MKKDDIDFHGTLKLKAKVSETMTGWKRWVLKPIDLRQIASEGSVSIINLSETISKSSPAAPPSEILTGLHASAIAANAPQSGAVPFLRDAALVVLVLALGVSAILILILVLVWRAIRGRTPS